VNCNDLNACKFKIHGDNTCDGTVAVSCDNELRFYYDANGNPTFNIPAQGDDHFGGRALGLWEAEGEVQEEEKVAAREEEAAAREDAFLSSLLVAGRVPDVASSPAEGLEDGTSGSSLRGTLVSKRIL
jgi:hypothetical protein